MRKKAVPVLRKDGLIQRKWFILYALKVLDLFGAVFLRKYKEHPKNIKRILVIHFGGFGDGILMLSLMDSLRALSGQYQFDLFTNVDIASAVAKSDVFKTVYTIDNYFKWQYIKHLPEITSRFRLLEPRYDLAIALRSGIDNGILPLYLSGIARTIAGFKTGGFSFC